MIKNKLSLWTVLSRREVLSICLFVFMADMIIGITSPTRSLFAQSLGASLTLVGILATMLGLTRLLSSMVIGAISDRQGRKSVLLIGMGFLAIACLGYALVTTPYLLLPINIILGLGFIATLSIAFAYAADAVSMRERSLVIGFVATSMGLGFAVGSGIGGFSAATWGYRPTYGLASLLAGIGLVIGWASVPRERQQPPAPGQSRPSFRQQIKLMLTDRLILAVCAGSVLSNLVFGGLVVTFFPIYAHDLGISQGTIGSILAIRALISTLARMPAGILSTVFPGQRIMLSALVMSTLVAFSLPQSVQPPVLMIFLIGEGIAYGLFLTAGQASIAEHADEANRGTALGVYNAAASVGDSIAPFFLGILADAWGVRSVFYVVGALTLLGVVMMARSLMRYPASLSSCPQE